jgi:hypothetical protein
VVRDQSWVLVVLDSRVLLPGCYRNDAVPTTDIHAIFMLFMAIKIQVAVFWIVTSCRDVVRYERFGEPYCRHLQGGVEV